MKLTEKQQQEWKKLTKHRMVNGTLVFDEVQELGRKKDRNSLILARKAVEDLFCDNDEISDEDDRCYDIYILYSHQIENEIIAALQIDEDDDDNRDEDMLDALDPVPAAQANANPIAEVPFPTRPPVSLDIDYTMKFGSEKSFHLEECKDEHLGIQEAFNVNVLSYEEVKSTETLNLLSSLPVTDILMRSAFNS